jgi:hypothetical protein
MCLKMRIKTLKSSSSLTQLVEHIVDIETMQFGRLLRRSTARSGGGGNGVYTSTSSNTILQCTVHDSHSRRKSASFAEQAQSQEQCVRNALLMLGRYTRGR